MSSDRKDIWDDRELARWLSGELSAQQDEQLRDALQRDPSLRLRARELRAAWSVVELQPPSPAPPGYATRVLLAARSQRAESWAWSAIPTWARAAWLAAVMAGLLAGLRIGAPDPAIDWPAEPIGAAPTLTDQFWHQILSPNVPATAEETRH